MEIYVHRSCMRIGITDMVSAVICGHLHYFDSMWSLRLKHFLVIWSMRVLSLLFLSIPSLVMASVEPRIMAKIDWWYENRFVFYFHLHFAWEGDFINFCNLWGQKKVFSHSILEIFSISFVCDYVDWKEHCS